MPGNKEPGNKNDTNNQATNYGWGELVVGQPMAEDATVAWNELGNLEWSDEVAGPEALVSNEMLAASVETVGAGTGHEQLDAWEERVTKPNTEAFWAARRNESLEMGKDIGELPELESAGKVADDFFMQRFPGMNTETRVAREAMAIRALEARVAERIQRGVARGEEDVEKLRRDVLQDELRQEGYTLERMYVQDPMMMLEAEASGSKLSENEKIAWALASEAGQPGQMNLMLVREKYPRRENETPDDYIQRIKNYSRQDLNREKQLKLDKESGGAAEDERRRAERMRWQKDFMEEHPGWGRPQQVAGKKLGENGYSERYAPAERYAVGERESKIKGVLGKIRERIGFRKAVGKVMLALGQRLSAMGGAMLGQETESIDEGGAERPVEIHRSEYAAEKAGDEFVETAAGETVMEMEPEPVSMQGTQAEQIAQGEEERGTNDDIVMQTIPQMQELVVSDDGGGVETVQETVDNPELASEKVKAEQVEDAEETDNAAINEYEKATTAGKLKILRAMQANMEDRMSRIRDELVMTPAADILKRDKLKARQARFEGLWTQLGDQIIAFEAKLAGERAAVEAQQQVAAAMEAARRAAENVAENVVATDPNPVVINVEPVVAGGQEIPGAVEAPVATVVPETVTPETVETSAVAEGVVSAEGAAPAEAVGSADLETSDDRHADFLRWAARGGFEEDDGNRALGFGDRRNW